MLNPGDFLCEPACGDWYTPTRHSQHVHRNHESRAIERDCILLPVSPIYFQVCMCLHADCRSVVSQPPASSTTMFTHHPPAHHSPTITHRDPPPTTTHHNRTTHHPPALTTQHRPLPHITRTTHICMSNLQLLWYTCTRWTFRQSGVIRSFRSFNILILASRLFNPQSNFVSTIYM